MDAARHQKAIKFRPARSIPPVPLRTALYPHPNEGRQAIHPRLDLRGRFRIPIPEPPLRRPFEDVCRKQVK